MAITGMAITDMATVRQSITALYEESEKSAVEGLPMLAVIDSEPPTPSSPDEKAGMNEKPTIAARFDELRRLADLEMPASRHGPVMTVGKAERTPETDDGVRPDTTPIAGLERQGFDPSADEVLLPSEPPTPAAGNGASDLDVDDIRRLVQEAWEDETATGPPPTGSSDNVVPDVQVDAPDIESAMEDIAAAVVQSGDTASAVNLEDMRAELVAAVRAELQAVVETDLKEIVKAAVTEALKDMPVAKSATGARKATATKAAKKKAAPVGSKND